MIFKKRWYFTLKKGTGAAAVELFLYRKNKKFYTTHQLHSRYLFNWYQALWFWWMFNLPSSIKKNGSMFGYASTTGIVYLKKMEAFMLD